MHGRGVLRSEDAGGCRGEGGTGPQCLVLCQDTYEDARKTVGGAVRNHECQVVKASDKGAVQAVVYDGPKAGTTCWIKPYARPGASGGTRPKGRDGKPKPLSLKEKRAKLAERRRAWIIRHVCERLREANMPTTGIQLVQAAGLVCVFGTQHLAREGSWKRFEGCASQSLEALTEQMVRVVQPVLFERLNGDLQYGEPATAWKECLHVCELFGLDTAELQEKAEEAMPEPKSWSKETAS